uniref:Eukaryotic peptide chain release factor subunit 1-3-like isoform X1 n=1 Tax=Rhizophora mucronata TaxID=61149 RepID=A0A2P2NN98_RHIMU
MTVSHIEPLLWRPKRSPFKSMEMMKWGASNLNLLFKRWKKREKRANSLVRLEKI